MKLLIIIWSCTASQSKTRWVQPKNAVYLNQFIILVKSGTSPFINSTIHTSRMHCKSKGSQCCTPINLHVWIMQLVWIPSMCRAACQVVCLLTHVCSCIHTPTVSEWLSAAACGKAWLLCWKSACARTPCPRPPIGVRERNGACCPSPPSSSRRDGMIKAALHEATNLESTECLLLSSVNL